jgi:uncharacterized HhH-GPD family protein
VTTPERINFTGDEEADRLLADNPLALVIGFALDQQVPLQRAFSSPLELKRRIGTLDAAAIASMDPAALEQAFRERPALHRFPGSMARRTQELCAFIDERYGGEAARIWLDAKDGRDLERRLYELPGFGEMKVKALTAVIGKLLDAGPPGWEEIAPAHMTLGDVDSPGKLAEYQAAKRAHKASLRAAKHS